MNGDPIQSLSALIVRDIIDPAMVALALGISPLRLARLIAREIPPSPLEAARLRAIVAANCPKLAVLLVLRDRIERGEGYPLERVSPPHQTRG